METDAEWAQMLVEDFLREKAEYLELRDTIGVLQSAIRVSESKLHLLQELIELEKTTVIVESTANL